jgi:hypothetical protein
MAFRLIDRPKTVKVTKSVAREHANLPPAPGDRGLKEARLQSHRKSFQEGTMRPVEWATAYCKENGLTYRVNGNHTSTILSEMIVPDFYVTIHNFECDTLHDVSRLYSTFDSRIQIRNNTDINRSYCASIPELSDFPDALINQIISGIAYSKWKDEYFGVNPTTRAEQIFNYVNFAVWIREMTLGERGEPVSRNFLTRVAVITAMLETWQKNKADATKFWSFVRDQTGESPDLPDRKLAKYLLLLYGKGSPERSRFSGRTTRVQNREILCKCIKAWNAYRTNKPTNLKYSQSEGIPKIL